MSVLSLLSLGLLGLSLRSAVSGFSVVGRDVDCEFSISADANTTCLEFASEWGLSVAEFEELNPDVTCPLLVEGDLYCVIGIVTPDATSSSSGASVSTVGPGRTITSVTITYQTGTINSTMISFTPLPTPTTSTSSSTPPVVKTTTTSSSPASTGPPEQSGIPADCSEFHIIVSGDTCSGIEAEYGITEARFFAWNPLINSICSNLYIGYAVCVAAPEVPTSAASTPPVPVQTGIASNCNNYHEVQAGDTCASIESAYGITNTSFFAWNPAINAQCTNLFLGYDVCVGVSNTSSSVQTIPTIPTTFITSTTPPITTTSAVGPTQSGIPTNCDNYHLVVSGDSCVVIESEYGITADEFLAWNPSINLGCTNLLSGYYVCIGVPGATTGVPSTSTTSTIPTQSGIASNCDSFHLVVSGDTCSAIETEYDITAAEFLAWNPAINSACSNLLLGYDVCVGVPGVTAPTTTATSTIPTQSGISSNCSKFHLVVSGDSCSVIETEYSITSADFLAWNSAINSACSNLLLGYDVCVGVSGTTTTPTTTTSIAPSPLMPSTISTCTTYHLVVSGDSCAAIELAASITSAQFLLWNPYVDTACDNLFLGYYVYIGV